MDKDSANILFLGEDSNYYSKVQKKLQSDYSTINFKFKSFKASDLFHGIRLIIPIVEYRPTLIFLDYSKKGNIYLKLAKYIRGQASTRKVPIFGLASFKSDQTEIHKGIISGMRINYIKSSIEINEIIHNMILAISPDKTKDDLFPEVKNLNIQTQGFHFFRIGYLAKDHVHIETNLDLEINSELSFQNSILKKLKLNNFKVENRSREGLYYNFKYSYNLSFLSEFHIFKKDNVLKNSSISNSKKAKMASITKKELEEKYKSAEGWIKKNKNTSYPKKDKLLVIDHNFTPLVEAKEMIDQYHFSFRVHQCVDSRGDVIRELKACVIALQLDNSNKETHSDFTNGLKTLKKIVKTIKGMKDYSPLILIFNSLLQEKTLKRFIKYNKIMSFSNDLKLTELIQIFKKHHWDEKYYNNSKIKIELPKKHFFLYN